MIRKIFCISTILIFCAAFLFGCSDDSQTDTNTIGSNDRKTVLTSFYPIYISVINVTKDIDNVDVVNMTRPQLGCLHDYSLTTEDLMKIEKADILIINGAGMESFIDKVIEQREDLTIIDASKGIELIKNENGEKNSHVFVSISHAMRQVENIADGLALADSANTSKYKSNAGTYIDKLKKLKEEMHFELDKIENRDIVTFHGAFPYFAQEFNLNIKAVIEREPGTSPTAKELEDTIEIVKNSKVRALFTEPQYSQEAVQIIANSTGAEIYSLDPVVTGEANEDAYDDYIKIMKKNLITLKEALS